MRSETSWIRTAKTSSATALVALATLGLLGACGDDEPAGGGGAVSGGSGGSGGVVGGGGSGGVVGGGGQGGEPICTPDETQPCYEGPDGTEDVGICVGGTEICDADGFAWGECQDQVVPDEEDCEVFGDEDCDGVGCGDALWALIAGDSLSQFGFSVVMDSQDNVIVAGIFEGAIDLGGTPLVSQGESDIFVAKFSLDGVHQWSRSFGGVDADNHIAIAVTATDDVVLAGTYRGTINLGPDAQTELSAPDGVGDMFLAKLAPDGSHLWSRYLTGRHVSITTMDPVGDRSPRAVAVDGSGDIVVGGQYTGHWGGFFLPPNVIEEADAIAGFVRKYDADGAIVWARGYDGPGHDRVQGVALDASGNVAIVGRFEDTLDFGGGHIVTKDANHSNEGFVAALNVSGDVVWVNELGAAGAPAWTEQIPREVLCDASGVVVAGYFSRAIDFGAGPVDGHADGDSETFIAAYDLGGNPTWSQTFVGPGVQRIYGLARDHAGDLVLSGTYAEGIDLGGTPLVAASERDLLVAKLDSTGSYLWSRGYGTSGTSYALAVAVGSGNEIALVGYAGGEIDLGTGPLTAAGEHDVIVALMSP